MSPRTCLSYDAIPTLGIVIAAWPAARLIGEPVFGWLADRTRRVPLMVVGLLWIVVFYITSQRFPIEAIGRWNLGVGFGLMLSGFLMTTRWR